ncbi:MAG: hypothetical protein LBQ64_03135, partial [Bacteroidales bacterium]|nr:hypothetical protein [Bacteroidales bacterium]
LQLKKVSKKSRSLYLSWLNFFTLATNAELLPPCSSAKSANCRYAHSLRREVKQQHLLYARVAKNLYVKQLMRDVFQQQSC